MMTETEKGGKGLLRVLPSKLKKYLFEYLDTRVIFMIDVGLSFLSSVLVLFIVSLFSSSEKFYLGTFASFWMGSSLLAIIAALLVFKTHKVVIRYSQMRDLLGIFRISVMKVLIMWVILTLCTRVNSTVLIALLADFLMTSVFLIGIRIAKTARRTVAARPICSLVSCRSAWIGLLKIPKRARSAWLNKNARERRSKSSQR